MRSSVLPFSPPLIGEEEIAEVVDTLRSDWITTGPKVSRFERAFADAVGADAALALSSCTAALHVALAALGIGPGDAVITSPMTFCSGVHVIEQVGAKPVLVDVEPDTLNIDPIKVRATLNQLRREGRLHVKAIMPVHLYGHPCDRNALHEIAHEHKIAIIEDAAHSLPASYGGRLIGAAPKTETPVLTCFSFYATKNMTTGEGGMLCGPPALIDEARTWSLHGMSRDAWRRYSAEGSWYYEVVRPGFKYNMTDVQAALGLHQLWRLWSFHKRRTEIATRYNRAFATGPSLEIPTVRPGVEHAWHIYALRLKPGFLGISRNRFIEELKARRISASVHFIPVHIHPYYRDRYGYQPERFPVAYGSYKRLVSLPIYPRMTDQDVEDVIEAVLEIAERYGMRESARETDAALQVGA
ncbi:MAG TPA: DegT/DnrJ/EryC1/StrS aminotransferase family protein [Terriglobia bacterium]|nr:DegT/DnrJ/EryC1/StrS aminotransferase family protein [Terriglobia bacterium]